MAKLLNARIKNVKAKVKTTIGQKREKKPMNGRGRISNSYASVVTLSMTALKRQGGRRETLMQILGRPYAKAVTHLQKKTPTSDLGTVGDLAAPV